MRGSLTLTSVNAGSLFRLLAKIKAEIGRKEMFMSELTVNQECGKRETREASLWKEIIHIFSFFLSGSSPFSRIEY